MARSLLMKRKQQLPFFNRELSWLEFNARVLGEALDRSLPLLERLKFLCIVSSNFDEFFMVRVAALKRQAKSGVHSNCPSGMSVQAQLSAISRRVRELLAAQQRCFNEDVRPALAKAGINIASPKSLDEEKATFLRNRFDREILPVLTPVRADSGRPLSVAGNLRLHAAFLLVSTGEGAVDDELPPEAERLAIVQLPPSIERVIHLPSLPGNVVVILLEDVIIEYASRLFPGYRIKEHALFRLTRDADFAVDEDRDEDFVEAMAEVLAGRRTSETVRLTVSGGADKLTGALAAALGLGDDDVFRVSGPLNLKSLMSLTFLPGYDHLRDEHWRPTRCPELPEDEPIWPVLSRADVLLHHPYESFAPVVRLVQEAAVDPHVLAIKMTLYRTSGDSPIVRALEDAATNGKQVTALVELKARFDEEQNIEWAERLERAGVIVIYGIARLKVHAKALLVVRKEEAGIRRYAHLGTGNYNDKTARLYTDYGILTTREDLAYEISLFFNAITGYSAIPNLKKLIMAPTTMKSRVIQLIDREAARSTAENPGLMMGKMNSLADPDVIRALYAAARAGVRINLNIRGICMLVPGVPGLSETVRVVSIVDRFLEHARVFHFQNNGADELYCASADWMGRNLEGRVELMFPVEQEDIKRRLIENLRVYFKDNTKAHLLQPDGRYVKIPPGDEDPIRAQQVFYDSAVLAAADTDTTNRKEFTVRRRPPR